MSIQILVTKPKTLTPAEKGKLRKAGIVCIETEAPGDIRLLGTEGPPMNANDMLYAAMRALAHTPDDSAARHAKTRFVETMARLMQEAREPSTNQGISSS